MHIQLTCYDSCGLISYCSTFIEVVDITPPVITYWRSEPIAFWPPNSQHRPFQLAQCIRSIQDNCDGDVPFQETGVTVSIVRVTCNEARNANGLPICGDIVITGQCSASLKVVTSGSPTRIYTVYFSATDFSGNVAYGTCTILVPGAPLGSGPSLNPPCNFCVGNDCGNCPSDSQICPP